MMTNLATQTHLGDTRSAFKGELMSPLNVARDYGIPIPTQAVWRCTDRYGFKRLVIKLGRSVRYRRDEFDLWVDSRRAVEVEA